MTEPQKKHSNALLFAIIGGIVVGIGAGGLFPAVGVEVSFIGDMFLNALKMLVVPLVMSSLIVGITRLGDVRKLGSIASKTMVYFLTTTAIAVVIGIGLVLLLAPGKVDSEAERLAFRGGELLPTVSYRIEGNSLALTGAALTHSYRRADERGFMIVLGDQPVRGVIVEVDSTHANIVVAGWKDSAGQAVKPLAEGAGLAVDIAVAHKVEGKSGSAKEALIAAIKGLVTPNLVGAMAQDNILPLLLFSLVFGGVLTTIGSRGTQLIELFRGLELTIMQIVELLMRISPVGIGCLVAGKLGHAGGFEKFIPQLRELGVYAFTVVLGLVIHGVIVLPLILKLLGKRSPIAFAKGFTPALVTAFSTASSSATLPTSLECCERGCGVSARTTGFVVPLGATLNMDGTALYEAVAAIFIANMYGIELSFGVLIIIFLTSTLAAIGAAGIPEAGLVTMVIVLSASGLPIEGISMILIIDWALDRCRTTINVWGDAIAAGIIDQLEPPPASEYVE